MHPQLTSLPTHQSAPLIVMRGHTLALSVPLLDEVRLRASGSGYCFDLHHGADYSRSLPPGEDRNGVCFCRHLTAQAALELLGYGPDLEDVRKAGFAEGRRAGFDAGLRSEDTGHDPV